MFVTRNLLFFCALWSVEVRSEILKLNEACPPQGFYKDDAGNCRYALPYRPGIGSHNGQWMQLKTPVAALAPKQIDLGRYLFFDPILSRNQDMSCATCHDPRAGLADGRARAKGAEGRTLALNTPSLWNTGFQERWFWDGRAHSLEDQMTGPLFAPDEMGSAPEIVEQRLNEIPAYKLWFKEVYGKRWTGKISTKMVVDTLTAFERSLVSFNSRYDHFVLGDTEALNAEEQAGFNLFRSFLTRCSECHTPPLFTNQQTLFIGVPPTADAPSKANPIIKVPTLRNISATAPYMHAGQFATLPEVVEFYNNGGGRPLGVEPKGRIHWHVRPINLSDAERRALVAFLHTLNDPTAKVEVPKALPSGLKPMLP